MKLNQLLAVTAAGVLTACSSNVTEVKSPDGTIKFNLDNTESGLTYTVSDSETVVVSPSRLGFVLADGEMLDKFDIKSTATSSHDETWETTWGEIGRAHV